MYTRDYQWNQQISKQVFEKFKTEFEDLYAPIGDAALRHFKKAYGSWAQNCRERGRFEAFDYALTLAERAYEDELLLEDMKWFKQQREKIGTYAINQLKRKRSNP